MYFSILFNSFVENNVSKYIFEILEINKFVLIFKKSCVFAGKAKRGNSQVKI